MKETPSKIIKYNVKICLVLGLCIIVLSFLFLLLTHKYLIMNTSDKHLGYFLKNTNFRFQKRLRSDKFLLIYFKYKYK